MAISREDLRRYAVARSLFPPTTLTRALRKLGFVQADPIRAPARAQDLTLRHRVKGYKAGDLERRYPRLDLEEGFFVNYGFLHRDDYLRMHPREKLGGWGAGRKRRGQALVEFIRERGTAHPREIEARFAHGKATNYWGGSSNATTHLLGDLHYLGLLRVARRDSGVRVYAVQEPAPAPADADAHLDALIDIIVNKYAPLPSASLAGLIGRLRYAAPQWAGRLKKAIPRAKQRLAHARVGEVDWYWPEGDRPGRHDAGEAVRLLSPFDPVVWDRRRFELLWGWAYRFEAYTPAAKRKLGYYALPLLWRDRVVGWCNAAGKGDALDVQFGFVDTRPRDAVFKRELDAELTRLRAFLV
ncbi:MAG: crosslink repair DNA glycosylase YcaQ family protein [Vicinamibacterales bacterium]